MSSLSLAEDDDASGWAIRRDGSCLLRSEVDCGATVRPFRACCPSSTLCPSQYNVACCVPVPGSGPGGSNCTAALVEQPRCANASWTMFDNGGYFCCEPGNVGYDAGGSNGCSASGLALPEGARPLAVVDQDDQRSQSSSAAPSSVTSATSTTSATSATSSATIDPTPDSSNSNNDDDDGSGSPAGAIAGGVVGGVAGLALIVLAVWFLLWRRRRRPADAAELSAGKDGGAAASVAHGGSPHTGYESGGVGHDGRGQLSPVSGGSHSASGYSSGGGGGLGAGYGGFSGGDERSSPASAAVAGNRGAGVGGDPMSYYGGGYDFASSAGAGPSASSAAPPMSQYGGPHAYPHGGYASHHGPDHPGARTAGTQEIDGTPRAELWAGQSHELA